jgi:hypothetical protein
MVTKRRGTIKSVKEPSSVVESLPSEYSSKSYFRIFAIFAFLTLALILLAIYFIFYGVKIYVAAQKMPISIDAVYEIKENPVGVNSIRGKTIALEEEKIKIFKVVGDGKKIQDFAHGNVTIYNNTNRAQPLVAKTRFLSDGGVLFRIRKDIIVPTSSSLQVQIYADERGAVGNISPGTFILPGLSAPLQKQIYAKSSVSMAGGETTPNILTEEILKNAKESLVAELGAELKKEIRDSLKIDDLGNIAFGEEILNQESSGVVGEEIDSFELKIKLREIGVSWDKDTLIQRAVEALSSFYPFGNELISNNFDDLSPAISKYSIESGTTTISVNIKGVVVPSKENPLLGSEHFRGLTSAEIENYLKEMKLAESARIEFFPFWTKRAPENPAHIKIIVEK